jgi:hypothetical protein
MSIIRSNQVLSSMEKFALASCMDKVCSEISDCMAEVS